MVLLWEHKTRIRGILQQGQNQHEEKKKLVSPPPASKNRGIWCPSFSLVAHFYMWVEISLHLLPSCPQKCLIAHFSLHLDKHRITVCVCVCVCETAADERGGNTMWVSWTGQVADEGCHSWSFRKDTQHTRCRRLGHKSQLLKFKTLTGLDRTVHHSTAQGTSPNKLVSRLYPCWMTLPE